MRLFGKKTHPVLEKLLLELKMDMSNNYKDNAQDDFSKLEKAFAEMLSSGKLSERQIEYYEEQIHELRMILKGYTHKDQKATW